MVGPATRCELLAQPAPGLALSGDVGGVRADLPAAVASPDLPLIGTLAARVVDDERASTNANASAPAVAVASRVNVCTKPRVHPASVTVPSESMTATPVSFAMCCLGCRPTPGPHQRSTRSPSPTCTGRRPGRQTGTRIARPANVRIAMLGKRACYKP